MGLSATRALGVSEVSGLAVAIWLLLAASSAPARTIVVPSDQPSIQQGINASVDGDTVLVMPGTYIENILIDGDIAVRSAGGPAVTIIDGSQPDNPDSGSVVRFYVNGSIEGFDIRNGSGTGGGRKLGAGIHVYNWNDPNTEDGPLIMGNWINDNWLDTSPWDRGGGINVTGSARIIGNRIYNNGIVGDGLGAAIFAATPVLPTLFRDNEVYDNSVYPSTPGQRTGVHVLGGVVSGNVIACNAGGWGAGVSATGLIELNTIVGNWSYTDEPTIIVGISANCDGPVTFMNNNVTDNAGGGVECLECDQGDPVYLGCNNISGNFPGGQVIGICSEAIGQDGNISVDPVYGSTGCEPGHDYWCLSENSPLLLDPPPGCGLIGALGLCPPIGIHDMRPQSPPRLQVRAPRPNPFLERTTIPFYLPHGGEVSIGIYDVVGRRVRALEPGWRTAGDHALEWDGRDDAGRRVPSGAYVARIGAGGEELTRTLLLIR
jgi:hypothetical protein